MSETDVLRDKLDMIQANIPQFEPFVSKTKLRKSITLWRECITISKKHYPKPPELSLYMNKFDITDFLSKILTLPASHQDLKDYVLRFENLLAVPQTIHDNWADIHPDLDDEGKPMMRGSEYYSFLLKQLHDEDEIYPEGVIISEQPHIPRDGKRFKNAYKKYVKEWKTKWQSK